MVERRVNADDWLRQISHAEDAVLPTNLGSLPSDRVVQSTQIHKPKLASATPDELLTVPVFREAVIPDSAKTISGKKPPRKRITAR